MHKIKKSLALLFAAVLLFCAAAPAFAAGAEPEAPFPNSAFFETGAYRIHYRVFPAENEKGRIFMIHGFALSSYCFVMLAERLAAAGYTCALADLPDFGYSTRETVGMELRPREDIMHELMVSLSGEPWFVAGHSMGGYVALALAAKYPESVKNLLLYGTNGNEGVDPARAGMMKNPVFISIMGPMMEALGRSKPLVRLLYAAACNSLPFAFGYDVSKITDPYQIKGTGAGAILNFSMLPATDFEAVKTMPPILFLNGGSDKVITDGTRVSLRNALPYGSWDIVIPEAGHMVIETHADVTAAYTVRFLADK